MPEGEMVFMRGSGCALAGRKGAARAAFPGGDLPAAPGGVKARPEPVCNGAGSTIFRRRPKRAALHREEK
jgi:hypothetical protein